MQFGITHILREKATHSLREVAHIDSMDATGILFDP